MNRLTQSTFVVVLNLLLGFTIRADDGLPAQNAGNVPFNQVIKDELLKNLPRDLAIHKAHNWNQQAPTPSIRGLRLAVIPRNHGNWEKMTLVCPDLPDLHVVVNNLIFPTPDRIAFSVHVDLPASVEFEKQTWENGVQLYGGRCRGRLRLGADFKVEFEAAPNSGVRERITPRFNLRDASVSCYDFVPEHVVLVGGDLALLTGGSFRRTFKYYQSGFEQDMLALLRPALVQACDSPEVAAAWSRLLAANAAQPIPSIPPDTLPTPELLMPDDAIEPACLLGRGPVVCVPAWQRAALTMDVLLNGRRSAPAFHAGHPDQAHMDVHSVLALRQGTSLFSGMVKVSGMLLDAGLSSHGSSEHTGSGHGGSEHSTATSKDHAEKK